MSDINDITDRVIGAAIQVHKVLGPGLLESPYQACLAAEMGKRDIRFQREVAIPIIYDDITCRLRFRPDFLVENQVVVEVQAVKALDPIFTAQVLSYLKLGGYQAGLLINFNVKYLGEGSIPGWSTATAVPFRVFRAFRGERCLNVLPSRKARNERHQRHYRPSHRRGDPSSYGTGPWITRVHVRGVSRGGDGEARPLHGAGAVLPEARRLFRRDS